MGEGQGDGPALSWLHSGQFLLPPPPCPGWRLELQEEIWCHVDKSIGKICNPLRYIFLIDGYGFEELKIKPDTYYENTENKLLHGLVSK